MSSRGRRDKVESWLGAALAAVDPESVTSRVLKAGSDEPATLIAIGKAAAAMCRGAAEALPVTGGICVTNAEGPVPDGVELIIGDHPVPDSRSMEAGRRVLEHARSVRGRAIALISGGGSALCEQPRSGIDVIFIQSANRVLLDGGASIEETNLVRGHLSAVKCGGVARAIQGPTETYVISDVASAGPEVVASAPTVPMGFNPSHARQTMESYGNDVSKLVVAVRQPCRVRYRRRAAPAWAAPAAEKASAATVRAGGFRVCVDRDLCQGHAVCVREVPEVFEIEREENKVALLAETPDPGLRERVEIAVRHCPTRALSIEE